MVKVNTMVSFFFFKQNFMYFLFERFCIFLPTSCTKFHVFFCKTNITFFYHKSWQLYIIHWRHWLVKKKTNWCLPTKNEWQFKLSCLLFLSLFATPRVHEICLGHRPERSHPEPSSPHTLCWRPRAPDHPVPTEPKWVPTGRSRPLFSRWATPSPHAPPRKVHLHVAVGVDAARVETRLEGVAVDAHVQECLCLVLSKGIDVSNQSEVLESSVTQIICWQSLFLQ